jgi:hypothetical protein
MSTVHHSVILKSDQHFGNRVPPRACGVFLSHFGVQIRHSISMAFRGASHARGRPPHWLDATSDIRFVEIEGGDTTVLHFEAPTFGDAAPELYEQVEFWPSRPDHRHTGFEVFAELLRDIAAQNRESNRFDPALLRGFRGFSRVFDGFFREARIEDARTDARDFAVLTPATIDSARCLGAEAPPARRVRVVGVLDMIRESTQSFAIRLDSGDEIRGILAEGSLSRVSSLFNERVAAEGRGVFRPSGGFLRLDADVIVPGEGVSDLFSRVPIPLAKQTHTSQWQRTQTASTGVNAFFGRWPGEETEEELLAALDELG